MTTQQLKDLITGTLGPIVDAAARIADTRGTRDILDSQAKDRTLIDQLAYLVAAARNTGALATPAPTNGASPAVTQIATRADSRRTSNMATTAQPRRTIDAYDDRVSALLRERSELVRSVIATHGMHPDAWPTEALDRIAAFDGRVRALELLKAAAISVSVSWGTKPV